MFSSLINTCQNVDTERGFICLHLINKFMNIIWFIESDVPFLPQNYYTVQNQECIAYLAVQSINMTSSLLPCITEVKFIHFFYFFWGEGGLYEDDLDLNDSVLITIVILYHGCHFIVFPCIHLSGTWQVDANLVSITVFCSHNGGSLH